MVMKIGSRMGYRFLALALLSLLGLTSCGGGVPVAGGGKGGTGIGVAALTKGSFSVNGLKDPRSLLPGATIRVDDNPNGTENDLRDGMEVKVKAHRIADDPLTPEAEIEIEKIEAEPEVRGQMENKGADDFTVNGQHVIVDDQTKFEHRKADGSFDNAAIDFTGIGNTFEVEVHGGRDDLGSIRATRVEWREDPVVDEVRGPVSGPVTATTFFIGAQQVDYGATGVSQSDLPVGRIVEAHGSLAGGVFVASSLDLEDVEDAEFEPAEGQEFEVEGFVANLGGADPDFTFEIKTVTVTTSASTTYENGSRGDLVDGVKVEAEGHYSQATNTLAATKIRFERTRVILAGAAGTNPPATLLGKTLVYTSASRLGWSGTGNAQVRGYEDGVGNIVVERLEDASGGGNKDIVQARVTAKTATGFTLLGFSVDLTGISPANLKDNQGGSYADVPAFLAAVSATPPGTLLKVKGSVSGTSFATPPDEAEIQIED